MLPRPASRPTRPAGVALRVELLENRQLLSGASLRHLLQVLPAQGPKPLSGLLAQLQPTALVSDSGIVAVDLPGLLPNVDLGSVGDLLLVDDDQDHAPTDDEGDGILGAVLQLGGELSVGQVVNELGGLLGSVLETDDAEGPASTGPDQGGDASEETGAGLLGAVLQLGGELSVGQVVNELGNLVGSVLEIGDRVPGDGAPTEGEGNGIGPPLPPSNPESGPLQGLEEHGTELPVAGQLPLNAGAGGYVPGNDATPELADLLPPTANQGPPLAGAENPGNGPLLLGERESVWPTARPATLGGLHVNGALRGAADLVHDREADEAGPASEPEARRADEGAPDGEESPADPNSGLATAQTAGGLALVQGELGFAVLSTSVGQAEAAVAAGDVVFSGAGTEEANGAEPNAIIALPQEADQLAEPQALDQAALEAALQQFLAQAGARGEEGPDLAGLEVPAYVAALVVGAAMFELRRRRRRRKQPSLVLAVTDSATTMTWMPGSPGSGQW